MGASRLWPSLSIIACGLVPGAILIRWCEAIEASRYRTSVCFRNCFGAEGGSAHGNKSETPMYTYISYTREGYETRLGGKVPVAFHEHVELIQVHRKIAV